MKLARFVPLLLLGACSSSDEKVALEAPDVHFQKAAVMAAVAPENRKEIEDRVAAELERRRPGVQVITTWEAFPNLEEVSEVYLMNYLNRYGVDMLVTIVPFSETTNASYDEWSDVASDQMGGYVEDLDERVLLGRFGVQVVGWDVPTKQPVYAKTSQIMIGDVAGTDEVADFAVTTVTRDI